MNVLIKQARIVDPHGPWHGQVADIVIDDGTISNIGSALQSDGARVVESENLHVSRGWIDTSVSFGEPGFEDRETIVNGLNVAARSGFTSIMLQPNTFPVIDNQSHVKFVLGKVQDSATRLLPIGSLTKGGLGKDLAELYDMQNAGAIAFGDYRQNMDNSNLLKIALQYAQELGTVVIAFAEDQKLKASGIANEGMVSTRLGLKAIPALAEEIMVGRNLEVLEYTGGRLHIPTISSVRSAAKIADAKAKGLNVTCSVSVHHLVLTDEKLMNFGTEYKVCPPLRDDATRRALIDAVVDGTIDMITSDHCPIDIEHKKTEFDYALDGTIGLESAFGALNNVLPLEIIIEKLTAGHRFFGNAANAIDKGSAAELTLFDPTEAWTFGVSDILSTSKNSAFIGEKMRGRALGIYNNGILCLHKN